MRYEGERAQLLAAINDAAHWRLAEPGGGAFSMRTSDGNFLVTARDLPGRRWHLGMDDFIVTTGDGKIVEQTSRLGVSGLTLHLAIYEMLPTANAVFHTHGVNMAAVSSLGTAMPHVTSQLDTLGEIPCLAVNDTAIKAAYRAHPYPIFVPDAMMDRPDVAAVNAALIEAFQATIAPRAGELAHHGLGFLTYRHGGTAVGTSIEQAWSTLYRMEVGAYALIQHATLAGHRQDVQTDPLYTP